MTDPYRNETAALRARVQDLETELSEAHATIARLQRPPMTGSLGQWLLGAPTRIELEHVLDGEIEPAVYEELLEPINRRISMVGQASIVGRRFHYAAADKRGGRYFDVTVHPQKGKTIIRLTERLGQVAGGLFGGIVGGLGVGGMSGVIPMALFAGLSVSIPLVCVAWLAFVWMLVRAGYKAFAARRRRNLEGLATEVVRTCREFLPATSAGRARVREDRDTSGEARDDDAADEALADVEAEAEAERATEEANETRGLARGTPR